MSRRREAREETQVAGDVEKAHSVKKVTSETNLAQINHSGMRLDSLLNCKMSNHAFAFDIIFSRRKKGDSCKKSHKKKKKREREV